jgi:hypothetical protein
MALPSAYLTSTKNTAAILEAIKDAQAPKRFTTRWLEGLGFPSSADRLMINVLKALGFLNDTGEPVQRYHEYLDKSQSKQVLARGIRDAYSDLFEINKNAHAMSAADLKNKMKTLSQGQHSDAVIQKMATTFKTLAGLADFSKESAGDGQAPPEDEEPSEEQPETDNGAQPPGLSLNGLVYNINIVLPESREPAVYDALFRSLKEHLR